MYNDDALVVFDPLRRIVYWEPPTPDGGWVEIPGHAVAIYNTCPDAREFGAFMRAVRQASETLRQGKPVPPSEKVATVTEGGKVAVTFTYDARQALHLPSRTVGPVEADEIIVYLTGKGSEQYLTDVLAAILGDEVWKKCLSSVLCDLFAERFAFQKLTGRARRS